MTEHELVDDNINHGEEAQENVEDNLGNRGGLLKGGKKSRKKRTKSQRGGKKRKGKKTKRRRRRKQKGGMGSELEHSQEEYPDGEGQQEGEGEGEEEEEVVAQEGDHQLGGKKRRKGKKGTKKKGKAGKWIMHVKSFAKSHKIKFPEALKHPDCKKSYKKM